MKHLPADCIAITGLGMCSSLGNTVLACAAARAGVSMSRDLVDVVISCRDGTDAAVTGHPVPAAAGFRGRGKQVRLGLAALEDLLEQDDLRSQSSEKLGIYLCLRARGRPSAPGGNAVVGNRSEGNRLCAQVTALAGLPVPEANWSYVEEGHAGFVHAVMDASARLRAGSWHRCLIGGIDSLLDDAELESLHASGRLKTPDKPDGLQPGEAGAFVLLERLDAAQRRGAAVMALLGAASIATEPDHAQSERPCRGVALTKAISQALVGSASQEREGLWLISDHNGEHARATELAYTLARMARDFPSLASGAPWCPAMSFGDTGAASAAVAACLAARAFVRGYAPGPTAVILSSSDREPRGALRLERETP